MKEALAVVLTIVLLVIIVLFIISLFKPGLKINKRVLKTSSRKRITAYYLGIAVVLFIFIGITAPPQTTSNQNAYTNTPPQVQAPDEARPLEAKEQEKTLSELYAVAKVVDGDTIEVNINGITEKLRLIGIDTPETVDPRKPVQCFGKEASSRAKELLEGNKVRLESDPSQDNRDKYDRLLRYVYLEDGTSYNKLIISEGYAHEYTYNIPYKYQSEYKQAQKDAESAQKGLWSPSTCSGNTEQSASKPEVSQPAPQPVTAPQPAPQQTSNCDPNYTPCIPNVSYDLDCGDISTSVQVIGTDRHRFDRDGDRYGCESN
jgi:micrococcal nuclease